MIGCGFGPAFNEIEIELAMQILKRLINDPDVSSTARGVPVKGCLTWHSVEQPQERLREYVLKRPLDISLSLVWLLISAPVFLLVAAAIKLEDRGPIFYTQERIGRHRRMFKCLKFRSMVPSAEAETGHMWATERDPRVTSVGRFLRCTACDELPQLLNILKGDMSFVGSRSHREFFYEKFDRELPGYARRYELRPGLTGMAQVFARYDSSARQKLRFDLLYMQRQSLMLDIKLIVASVMVSLLGRWDERKGKKLPLLHRFLCLGSGRQVARGRDT